MKRHILSLALQLCVCFIASLAVFMLRPISVLYTALKWTALPIIGAVSAFLVGRRGINAYLCWLMPPIALVAALLLATMGYMSEGGVLILDILTSIIGAAASDVYNKTGRKGRK